MVCPLLLITSFVFLRLVKFDCKYWDGFTGIGKRESPSKVETAIEIT